MLSRHCGSGASVAARTRQNNDAKPNQSPTVKCYLFSNAIQIAGLNTKIFRKQLHPAQWIFT